MLADCAKQRLEGFGNNTELGGLLAAMPGCACPHMYMHAYLSPR